MNPSNLRKQAHKVGVPIQKLSARIMTKLKDAPQAQKRTSERKKAVKIVKDFVFKGPYACDEKQLIKNLRYTCAIELLEAALQLDEWQRGSLRWEYLGCWVDDQYYLVTSNVGKWNGITHEPKKSKIEENVEVVPRKTHIMRVSDIEGTELFVAGGETQNTARLQWPQKVDLVQTNTQ